MVLVTPVGTKVFVLIMEIFIASSIRRVCQERFHCSSTLTKKNNKNL